MLVYFLGKEEWRPQFDCIRSNMKPVVCLFYSKIGAFMQAIKETKPQFVFVDFDLYNDEFFCLRDLFAEKNISVPLLYFNNPKVSPEIRLDFWLNQCSENISSENHDEYKNVLEKFSMQFENPAPVKMLLPDNNSKIESAIAAGKPDDFLYKIRKKHNLSGRQFFLLQALYNSARVLSKEELVCIFEKAGMPITAGGLTVCLSRLRKCITQEDSMDLIREGEGYRLIVFGKEN